MSYNFRIQYELANNLAFKGKYEKSLEIINLSKL